MGSPDSQLRSGYALPSSRILRHSLILIDVLFSSCLPVSNPQQRLVSKGEVRIFETHKRDVIDKRHIARQPGACFAQPWCGHGVKHDPHLDALSLVLQPKNRCDRAGAHGPQPRKQLSASAARLASAIRSLPWQAARRSRKSPLHARGFARTMSAAPFPGTSGLAASKSATGSSTPRSRRGRSNAP